MDSAEASRVELNDTAAARRRIPRVVVVDQQFDAYSELATSARLGRLEVHFRSSGAAAIKMATRRPADIWLVAGELDDMSGADFIELLRERLGEPTVAGVNHSAGRQEGFPQTGSEMPLRSPISFADLETLLGMPAEIRKAVVSCEPSRLFATLPVGVGATIVAIALLMMG
jgi:CheY-like chemotaxis protein